ncbi:MAG: AAA family ATPase [bacterium]|nr:AAA family ATPase [bacterium]
MIDELDSSLHTELVKKLIHVLHKKSLHFQIIFNTHDTNLLDIDELFRKDQIWFAEKDPVKGTSKLVRLSDKKIRKDMVVEKNYLK